jgi:hypothetical protein
MSVYLSSTLLYFSGNFQEISKLRSTNLGLNGPVRSENIVAVSRGGQYSYSVNDIENHTATPSVYDRAGNRLARFTNDSSPWDFPPQKKQKTKELVELSPEFTYTLTVNLIP